MVQWHKNLRKHNLIKKTSPQFLQQKTKNCKNKINELTCIRLWLQEMVINNVYLLIYCLENIIYVMAQGFEFC